jgi:hypothetical protein
MNDIIENKVKYAFERGFDIDKSGRVYGIKGKLLTGSNYDGYIYIGIRINGKTRKVAVHRLQAYKKFGDEMFGKGIIVRHLDGDSTNNSWDNIKIGNHSDNMMDISAEVRLAKALHATSFVRKHDKETIRAYYTEHKSYKKTMEHFNITSKGTLHFILNK